MIMRRGAVRAASLADTGHVSSCMPASCRSRSCADTPELTCHRPTVSTPPEGLQFTPAQHLLINCQWGINTSPAPPHPANTRAQQQHLRASEHSWPSSGLPSSLHITAQYLRNALSASSGTGSSLGFARVPCPQATGQRYFASSPGNSPSLKTQLRELYKRVHPDQFQDHPEAQVIKSCIFL